MEKKLIANASNDEGAELLEIVLAARKDNTHGLRSVSNEELLILFDDLIFALNPPSSSIKNGDDIAMSINITSSEALTGVTRDIKFKRWKKCHKCNGTIKLELCLLCNGQGQLEKKRFLGMFGKMIQCPDCNGSGKTIRDKCEECKGRGVIMETDNISVKIPANVKENTILRCREKGDDGINGGSTGNLYLVVKIK